MALNWLKSQLTTVATAGDSRRNQRIDAEVQMIAARFSRPPGEGVLYDEQDRVWLIIPGYPLPSRFAERRCDLLIVFPQDYPEMAPIGFYLNKPFQLRNGGYDGHLTGRSYHDAPDLTEQGWHWYCVRLNMGVPGAWKPSADVHKPDNLWTFLNMVRETLTNDF